MASERPKIVFVSRSFVIRKDDLILIVQRAAGDGYLAGSWECPGGKLDPGQDLSQVQEREVMEETGYLVEVTERLVSIDSHIITDGAYQGLTYIVVFSVTRLVGGKEKLSEEHDDAAWVTYDQLLDYELTPEVRKAAILLKSHLVHEKEDA